MRTYALVQDGTVLSHFVTDRPISDFPDIASSLIEAPANVRDGWVYDGTFHPYALTAEEQRIAAIEASLAADSTLMTLRGMNNAEFDAWWTANVTNSAQAIAVLKRIVRLTLRRL